VTAVAVFPTRPDARTLLDARLARGWKPTASELKDGSRILGYAACAVRQLETDSR
jgi:hypothetical protein